MEKIMKTNSLILHFPFDDPKQPLRNLGNNNNSYAKLCGKTEPCIEERCGRVGITFAGGEHGSSYIELPQDILGSVSDDDGLTITAWIYLDKGNSIWERIVDLGHGETGPYMFLTRMLHGECMDGSPLGADSKSIVPENEWIHVAFTVLGTKGGTLGSAGPRIYLNGELVGDGLISQTSSGAYLTLRKWFEKLQETGMFDKNYIGHSQYAADGDFAGTISDFKMYNTVLTDEEIIDQMCESLSDDDILKLAADKFLKAPSKIITKDIELEKSLMRGKVTVNWSSSDKDAIDDAGVLTIDKNADKGKKVTLSATLSCGDKTVVKNYDISVVPSAIAPYELKINASNKVLDISNTLYGLFFEDINHSADGGIYAEMIQNRSFEEFEYEIYDHRSGENGTSAGRKHDPLKYWFGTLDKVSVKNENGLRDFFNLTDKDANAYYIEAQDGCVLRNRGFCDNRMECAMPLKKGEKYDFSIWAKSNGKAGTAEESKAPKILVDLHSSDGRPISTTGKIEVSNDGTWKKYELKGIEAIEEGTGYIELKFEGTIAVDMVSLFPENVWGVDIQNSNPKAHNNYICNPNYRLRADLVKTLVDMKPKFLRFPGGCISEGSYIWDNVYDWKDSVGPVEIRKENYNVWGYTMTLGLGYMEYFQLAEDLGAEPLPVMACGVLCQARSDYANPAGGALRDKYISNFIDLIDFAIGTDFSNKWAAIRRDMGHPEPFGLHLLGVGNENWGPEFYANFELFEKAITDHMNKNYPGYDLTIVSTAGAQADDGAYQDGWRYLAGFETDSAEVAFTDGTTSTELTKQQWYKFKPDYLDTIVDEHYYRDNNYLLENVDRYTYYNRTFSGKWADEAHMPKVFVGEYASNEKNTLAGAIAEAATMIGFEKNSDVVRLASTAPLFNQPAEDGTYRWTPDCIWFDQEKVWLTPTYHIQKLFACNIGTELVDTDYYKYVDGNLEKQRVHGGILIEATGDVDIISVKVISAVDNACLYEHNFKDGLGDFVTNPVNTGTCNITSQCLEIRGAQDFGLYNVSGDFENAIIKLKVRRLSNESVVKAGLGLRIENGVFAKETMDVHEYCIGDVKNGCGLKVYKNGVEGYVLGDYSSSVYASNLRRAYKGEVPVGEELTLTLGLGGANGDTLNCYYEAEGKDGVRFAELTTRLDSYDKELFSSVTKDDKYIYIKLVNAGRDEKKVKVILDENGGQVSNMRKAVKSVLSGDIDLAQMPNINTRENSPIEVKSTDIMIGSQFEIDMPPVSVVVVRTESN
jgi:alpha-L-arabinofuranosidase